MKTKWLPKWQGKETQLINVLVLFLLIGTGSGLGTCILQILEDEFPEVHRFVTSIYPSGEDDVITSPYNSVLAMKELSDHADCVLPIENEVRI